MPNVMKRQSAVQLWKNFKRKKIYGLLLAKCFQFTGISFLLSTLPWPKFISIPDRPAQIEYLFAKINTYVLRKVHSCNSNYLVTASKKCMYLHCIYLTLSSLDVLYSHHKLRNASIILVMTATLVQQMKRFFFVWSQTDLIKC